jgi:phosphoglucosamine mutase
VIFLDHNTTGDGVLTSLQLLKVLRKKGQPLSVLADQLQKYPQLLRNVKVTDKDAWEENARIQGAISSAEEQLGDKGRIFVRASGTEPLIRVMAEGPDYDLVEKVVIEVAETIAAELGV